ncbi:hypothetical protein LCM4573_05390 [Rhizobium sp. LCM 4573]|nr:hypothetical protein LCM4573_05390 [Rhizobium sp. LCM 4573]
MGHDLREDRGTGKFGRAYGAGHGPDAFRCYACPMEKKNGIPVLLGVVLGVAIGAAMDNIGMGIGIGLALAIAMLPAWRGNEDR